MCMNEDLMMDKKYIIFAAASYNKCSYTNIIYRQILKHTVGRKGVCLHHRF